MEVSLTELATGSQGGKIHKEGLATKEWQGLFVKSIDQEKRQITAIASTGSIDRDGEIILPSAFKKCLPGYMKNPVILAGHQHKLSDGRSPVVAKCIDARVTKDAFQIVVEFAKTSLADEYWHLYRDKFQQAFSVGFMLGKCHDELRDGKRIPVHTEVKLIEISCVPVPSNPDALSRSVKRKRDFIANKRSEVLNGTAEQRKIDAWCKRLDLWDETETEDERKELFTLDEIVDFSKMDAQAKDFVDVIYDIENDISDHRSAGLYSGSGSGDLDDDLGMEAEKSREACTLIRAAVGDDCDDNEYDTGSLVELALGR